MGVWKYSNVREGFVLGALYWKMYANEDVSRMLFGVDENKNRNLSFRFLVLLFELHVVSSN